MLGHTRSRVFKFVSGLTVSGIVSTFVVGALPSAAQASVPDPITGGLTQWFDYLGGLAGKGPFASDLTGTTLDVGSVNGLDLAALATQINGDTWSSADSVGNVADALDGFDGTHGNWVFTTQADTVASDHGIHVQMTITRTVDVGLNLNDPAKDFDISSPSGVSAALTAHLDFTAERDDSNHFWVDAGAAAPSFSVGVDATLPGGDVESALGILGVTVTSSDFHVAGSITTAFADPNGDGKLDFTEADGTDGELSPDGSAGGVATPSIAPGGSLSGTLTLAGTTSSILSGLPSLSASVTVGSSDLSTGQITATYDSNAFDAVKPFQTLETKDLATALAQLASALQSSQRAKDLPLPLLKGSAADAIQAAQSIQAFLTQYVQQPPTGADAADPTKYIGTGHPKFASLQDLVDKLHSYTDAQSGATISLGAADAEYDTSDAAKPKVRLTLHLSNHATTSTSLDVVGPALTGSGSDVSYGACTQADHSDCYLQDNSKTFTPDLAGRQVTAGTSTALIDSVNSGDSHKLMLSPTPFPSPAPTVLWQGGGVPAAQTAYSISGADPRTGQVQMADALKGGSGLASVNASVPQATITPHYDVTLPMVLDLEPSVAVTPHAVDNPDGTQSIVSATPTLAERIMLHTGEDLLSGDLPINTAVDATAKVGFLQVHIGGTLAVCTNAAGVNDNCTGDEGDTRFVSIATKDLGDVALPDIFDKLAHHPDELLTASFNGRAYGALTLSVPGQNGFFTGGETTATLKWTDISNPATLSFTGPDLSKLLAFDISGLDDPTQLFGALLKALQTLDSSLHSSGSGTGPLDAKLPLLGKSVHDLLGGVEQGGPGTTYTADSMTDTGRDFTGYKGRRLLVGSATELITDVSADGHTVTVSPAFSNAPAGGTTYAVGDALLAALDKLGANPSDSLNELADQLTDAVDHGVTFTVVPATDTDPSYLKLNIDWARTLPLRVPMKFDLGIPSVPSSILGTSGKGTIDITATGEINVSLLFPLTADAVADPVGHLLVDPASHASVTADIHSDGVSLAANLGPLALSVGDPNNPSDPGTQIEGKLGFALSGTGSDPQSLDDFFSGLDVSADRDDDVTCDGVSGSDLALCANLPMFYKNGGSWTALGTGVTVAVPQDIDFSHFADYVTLPSESDIETALASQLIDLSSLSNGLDGYLQLLNFALQLADTAGKLPVVGPDIQQGLDFINGIKNAIETVIPVDANGGTQQVTDSDALQSKLDAVASQLQSDLDLPSTPHFSVATDCKAKLVAPNATKGAQVGPGSDTPVGDWSYRIVAYYNGHSTQYSPISQVLTFHNAAPSNATDHVHSNAMSWDPVTYADGYIVERQDAGSSTWKQLKDLSGNGSTSYTDNGTDTPAAAGFTPPDDPPTLNPCPGDAINGFKVKVVVGQGTVGADGCSGDDCVQAATRPLDVGLPGLSLSTTDPDNPNDLSNPDNGVGAKVGWELHLSFGLTKDKGFVVYTQDNDSDPNSPTQADSTPELAVGAALTAPKQFNGRLAFLAIQAEDTEDPDSGAHHTDHRQFAGAFSVDLHGAHDAACAIGGCAVDTDKVLTPDDFASNDFGSLITAKLDASVSLHYQVTVRSDAALPGIRTDFHLDWGWSSGDKPDKTDGLEVGFDNVRINPGSFLLEVLGPIFKQVNAVYAPIKPVLDTVAAPLPVLSDLSHLAGGGDVSILTLASAFADGSGDAATFQQFVDIFKSVKSVLDVINSVTDACGSGNPNEYDDDANFCIHIGSFDLNKGAAFDTTATPDTADSIIDHASENPDSTSAFDQIDTAVKNDPGNADGGSLSDAKTDEASSGEKNACGAGKDDRGFTLPALTNPTSLFGLVMGKDVELICFDSGPLSLGFTMSESFGPVYAPPPVLIVLSGSASVSVRIAAGFDTYGIRKAVEDSDAGVLSRAADFLDSLYFKTTDTNGHPIPVLQFQGSIAAGAEVSAVIISVGVEGGISLTVSFYWNDPDNDGKFRFREFLATALNNPICLFNVGGELDLFLKVFVTIGFSPFSVSFDFTLVNIKLLDFSLKPDCTPPPPDLGGKSGGTLYLFAGHLGTDALRGNQWSNNGTDDEKVVVRQHKDNAQTVTVQMLGITQDFTGVDKVVLDGRNYGGKISALFQGDQEGAVYDRPTVIVGGDKDDTFKTGSGPVWIDGGGGKDLIVTGDRPDLAGDPAQNTATVSGGGGDDSVTVGSANDTVYGDGSLQIPTTTLSSVHRIDRGDSGSVETLDVSNTDSISGPSDPDTGSGADRLSVGLGHDDVWGGGGDDTIGVAADSPLAATHAGDSHYVSAGVTAHGGPGSDLISTGSGADTIFTGDTFDPAAAPYNSDQDAIADRNASGDGGTTNTVDTGAGTDTVYGGNGSDNVTGHSDAAKSTKDVFYGGPGTDVLMGGYGEDELWGGQDDDYLLAEPSTVGAPGSTSDVLGSARTVTHTPTTKAPQKKILVGGGGHDRIYGGDGNSKIYGDHRDFTCSTDRTAADPSSDPPSESGVGSDDRSDLIYGGEGVDDINAGGGADFAYAKGGADYVCGSAGGDTLDAGNADDKVWAGSGGDLTYGGDGADHLYGNNDDDTTYGATSDDVIEGNNGKDILFGGDGNDTVVGGTRASGKDDTDTEGPDNTALGDTLYGDTGNDLLIGDNGVAAGSDSTTGRRVGTPFDLATTGTSYGAGDHIYGGADADSAYGGLGDDVIDGGSHNDYIEGNDDSDTITGNTGDDDIIGGSSQVTAGSGTLDAAGEPDADDTISGGAGTDVITGDNAQVALTGSMSTADSVMKNRGLTVGRHVTLLDLGYGPGTGTFGGDRIHGDDDSDVVYGERGVDTIHGDAGDDYVEGGQDGDTLFGDANQDDIVGGSLVAESTTGACAGQLTCGQLDGGDTISGGADADVILGDNGIVDRDATAGPVSAITKARADADGAGTMVLRRVVPFDLADSPTSDTSGADYIHGDLGCDVMLGQGGTDRIVGDADADYAEGDQGRDWIEGNAGDDDLIGGSSTIKAGTGTSDPATAQGMLDAGDVVFGGAGDDLITGDNAVTDRVGPPSPYLFRVGSTGALETQRSLRLLDLKNGTPTASYLTAPSRAVADGDQLSGGDDVDVVFGQDGPDTISGGADDDYAEGNGGHDLVYGDRTLAEAGISIDAPSPDWPGASNDEADISSPNGQDDLIGGSSIKAFRDGPDDVHGDGAADFVLGDNGTAVRNIVAVGENAHVLTEAQVTAADGGLTNQVYAKRYDPSALPADGAFIRHGTSATTPTRFCTTAQSTCEPGAAFGNDDLWGDAGEDTVYGQDGDDHIYGDTGSLAKVDGTSPPVVNDGGGTMGRNDDDLYGELGDDIIYGEFGDDAVLGDRGGIVDQFQDGSNDFVRDDRQVPQIHYEGFIAGSVTRQVDLLHDVNGAAFIGSGKVGAIPHRGDLEGGNDQIRGGIGHDSLHGGFGDDLINGDSGGDILFGDDGADVLWGGKGSDDPANPNDRGTNDALVDYLNGGKGATSGPSVDPQTGVLGSDIIDWHPRGTYDAPSATTCTTDPWPQSTTLTASGGSSTTTTVDPCLWFFMTDLDDNVDANNQHHQGIDWIYGGWDRDVLQGDVADNGPNQGDRLLDWTGAYNLYTHCNAAYGGYNDVRQFSPTMQSFLQVWAWSLGAGQTGSDVTTSGTSAFDELALVYQSDIRAHGSGRDFPTTPGHFDQDNACAP